MKYMVNRFAGMVQGLSLRASLLAFLVLASLGDAVAQAVPDADVESLLDNTTATWGTAKTFIITIVGFMFALWVAKRIKKGSA